jgi:hypothetical protein
MDMWRWKKSEEEKEFEKRQANETHGDCKSWVSILIGAGTHHSSGSIQHT